MADYEFIKIETSSLDAYDGQVDMIKKAIVDGEVVGYLKYAVYEDKPYVQMVEVKEGHRRKGIATELFKSLKEDFPNTDVELGMTTDLGEKLVNKITETKVNPEYHNKKVELEEVERLINENRKRWDEIHAMLDNDEGEVDSEEVERLNDLDMKLFEMKRNLEYDLNHLQPTFTYIKDSDIYENICKEELNNINQFLDKYGFEVELVQDYNFENENCMGIFLNTIQTNASVFPIALNRKVIEEVADGNLHLAIKSTIAHEAGHGIFEFLTDIYDMDDLDEEDTVEQFCRDYCDHMLDYNELVDILKQYNEDYN